MLVPWKKSYDKPRQCIKKQRFLPTEVYIVKSSFFSVDMYRCKSWIMKKAECWRTDAFKLWCWRRLLRVPWTAGRPNQSTLKRINPEYSLEGLVLKLKLQYCGHLIQTANSIEKTLCWERLKIGGGGSDRGWSGWMALLTQWTWVEQAQGVGDGQGNLVCCGPWGHKESDTT